MVNLSPGIGCRKSLNKKFSCKLACRSKGKPINKLSNHSHQKTDKDLKPPTQKRKVKKNKNGSKTSKTPNGLKGR